MPKTRQKKIKHEGKPVSEPVAEMLSKDPGSVGVRSFLNGVSSSSKERVVRQRVEERRLLDHLVDGVLDRRCVGVGHVTKVEA